jgi:hypothetical protein
LAVAWLPTGRYSLALHNEYVAVGGDALEPRPTCPGGLRDRVLGHILRTTLRGCVNGRRRRRLRGRIPNGTRGAIALHPSDALTFARFGCDSIDEATSRRLHTSRTSTHDNSGVRIARHASRKRRPGTPSSSCPSFTPRNSSGAHPSIFENQGASGPPLDPTGRHRADPAGAARDGTVQEAWREPFAVKRASSSRRTSSVSTSGEDWFLRAFRERDVGGRGPVDEKRATSGLRVPATARPAPIHDKCVRTGRIPSSPV